MKKSFCLFLFFVLSINNARSQDTNAVGNAHEKFLMDKRGKAVLSFLSSQNINTNPDRNDSLITAKSKKVKIKFIHLTGTYNNYLFESTTRRLLIFKKKEFGA